MLYFVCLGGSVKVIQATADPPPSKVLSSSTYVVTLTLLTKESLEQSVSYPQVVNRGGNEAPILYYLGSKGKHLDKLASTL